MPKIEDDYQALKKKYDLPEFKLLNHEFEISTIDENEFLLRSIRKKIAEKIDFFLGIIEVLMQPDTATSDLHECKIVDAEKDKDELYELYKKLKIIFRESTVLSIDSDDKNEAKFIKDTLDSWPDIKEKMLKLAVKMKESWKEDIKMHEKLGYLG